MAGKKNHAAVADPSLPFTEVEIEGKAYKMCLTYGALAKAESALLRLGHSVSLLESGPMASTFSHCRIVFACSLMRYQPEISFDAAQDLVTFENCVEVYLLMREAWAKALPKLDPAGAEGEPDALPVSK